MKIYVFLCLLILFNKKKFSELFTKETEVNEVDVFNKSIDLKDNATNRYTLEAFTKDIEELDLSGYEEDIENVMELKETNESYLYVTQIYVYIRIDGEYKKYTNHLELMQLGTHFMTSLQNAMLNVQLKKSGIGTFTCYFSKKEITKELCNYFLLQKEVDFLEVGFDKLFPEGRKAPITDNDTRISSEKTLDEL